MRSLALAAIVAMTVGPAAALDLKNMTDAEREAFRAEVRAYLLENPEVLSEAIAVLQDRQAEQAARQDSTLIQANAKDLFSDPDDFVGGNPQGDITVVEFIDYRCGYCRKAHAEVKELINSDGNIRYIVKEFPILGDQSVIASRFAIAALRELGPEAYEKIKNGFYESFRGEVTVETLESFARDLGIDPAPVIAAMDSPDVTRIIKENHMLAQRLQVSGTPTFVMGDQMLRGYAPLETMRQIVAEERG